MDVKLRVISGPFAGQTIELTSPKLLIGREQDCHLRPDSEFVSRHHCVLLLDPYTLRVRDLGSKNGTLVNNRRIGGEVVLVHDDTLTVGDMTLQVSISQDAPGSGAGRDADSSPILKLDAASQATDIYDGSTISTSGEPVTPPATPERAPGQQPVPSPIVPASSHQQPKPPPATPPGSDEESEAPPSE